MGLGDHVGLEAARQPAVVPVGGQRVLGGQRSRVAEGPLPLRPRRHRHQVVAGPERQHGLAVGGRLAIEQLFADGRHHFHVDAPRLDLGQRLHQVEGRAGPLGEHVAVPRPAGGEVAQHVEPLGRGPQIGVGEGRAVGHRQVGPRHLEHDHAHLRVAGRDLRRREVARRHVVVVPETEGDDLPAGEQLPHLRREDAEMGARIGRRLRPRVPGENVEHPDPERAVLVLLAPDARGQVHERRERAVAAAEGPDAAVDGRVEGRALADEAHRRGRVARLLDGRLEPRPRLVGPRVVVAGQRPLLDVDRAGEVGRQGQEAVAGDVVHPLDDLGDRPSRAGHAPRRLEQLDADLVRLAVQAPRHLLRFDRQAADAQPVVAERVGRHVEAQGDVVAHAVADVDQAVGQPVAEAVPPEHRQRHVDVGLELPQPLGRAAHRAVADALELDAVALLEGLGEGDEVRRIHLHRVGVAGVAHHLRAEAGDGPVLRGRPPPLGRAADDDHRPPVVRVPVLHGPQGGQHVVVVVAVFHRQHVPPVGGPLIGDLVAVDRRGHHPADQRVVDARVVVRQQDAQALAHLLGDGLRLHLLRVPGGHRELALQGHHLRRRPRPHEVPEGGLAGGGGDADAGGAAVDVVDEIGGLGMAGQRADAAQPGLGEQRVAGEAGVGQQGPQRPRPAAEAQAVDGQHRDVRVDPVAVVAGRGVASGHRLAHDDPQGVQGRDVVAAGQQQLVAERVLRAAVVVAQAAVLRPRQVQGDVVRRVRQRPAEMPRLLVVAQQGQGHRGQEADVLEPFAVVGGHLDADGGGCAAGGDGANLDGRAGGTHAVCSR